MANMQDIAPVTLSQPRVVVNHLRKPLVWPWRKCTYRGVRVPVKPVASEDEAPAGGKNENARIEVATEGVDDGSSDASDTTTVVGSNNGEDSGEDPHQDTEDEQDDDGNSGAGESGEDDNNEDGEEENDGGNSIDEEDDDDKTIIEEDTNSLETEEDTSGTESEEDGPVHEAAPILAFLPCTVTREPAPYRIRRVLERIPGDIWADLEYYLGDEIDSDEEEEDDTGQSTQMGTPLTTMWAMT
ncbi:hypothetical protein PHLGIDRAFT_485562 [Phlebiopsis gigantea 11061_1 CR5-6]|uniref:Uncharacterized protein n=1 Tax=Phlebiopsis gigantea (strain 11061_1 CR5-6) TaxID=745531 RepID=A0A0C3S8Z2_PHLG1|nr:hypothetical protein PHLGIDRAFT_485562 [Phlebiopsis gigantea 11061_1 CR5-6]